ncbi:hypothetical protein HMPREF0201_03016 [Cedecea davisae DSM 4568]|uniref:Uncharacterized protein n=1 Tax=Cedecea davisae DSM 4568 TaxID=566551 RepID=S3ITG4_9ENTR|nr:hypothetical protein HMPREF0201_03016 [Cedecea davisae DSM 4568]
MVAAFGDFQVCVVARSQLHALFRHQAQERVVLRFWHIVVNVLQNLLIAVWAGDFQHFRMHFTDLIYLCTQAAGDDHFSVFVQGFANRFQRFLHGAVDKTAGVDDNHIGVVIAWHHVVAFGTQFGQDTFGVHEVFRAAEGDKADTRLVGYIAHSLKSVQLLEILRQRFYRGWAGICTG